MIAVSRALLLHAKQGCLSILSPSQQPCIQKASSVTSNERCSCRQELGYQADMVLKGIRRICVTLLHLLLISVHETRCWVVLV